MELKKEDFIYDLKENNNHLNFYEYIKSCNLNSSSDFYINEKNKKPLFKNQSIKSKYNISLSQNSKAKDNIEHNINNNIKNNIKDSLRDLDNISLKKISCGYSKLNDFLEGGYDCDVITTFYGPSGSGKTTFCILAAVNMARSNKKVIYIDTEASFSVERLKQIAPKDYRQLMNNILFLKPLDFQQQQKAFDKLRNLVDDSIGMVIVDTISMLYRLAVGQSKDVYDVNKKLSMQLSYLTQISRQKKIPILVANQVYSSFDEKDKVNMVGGDILKYSSKTLIELQCLKNSTRNLFIRKSRYLPECKIFTFKLINEGIEEVK
jgi:DNA repair protein RadB